ncbi:hypothetical protein GCM10018965_064950 [Nonomuraea roseola]
MAIHRESHRGGKHRDSDDQSCANPNEMENVPSAVMDLLGSRRKHRHPVLMLSPKHGFKSLEGRSEMLGRELGPLRCYFQARGPSVERIGRHRLAPPSPCNSGSRSSER